MSFPAPVHVLGLAVLLAACASAVLTVVARIWWPRRAARVPLPSICAPVTVLKPLFGAEPRLYENLRSFCVQDHPDYQLLFGLHSEDDAALITVRRLQAEFPERDIGVVINPAVHGLNLKVSNLINLMTAVRHDWLLLADSDIEAPPELLRRVTAPLADPSIGVVTCLYRGRAVGGLGRSGRQLWARLGAQLINDWFLPSVCLARLLGTTNFAFGATIALRRDSLIAAGGFEALSDQVADDYWLGELSRRTGRRTLLSEVPVTTDVIETRFSDLAGRELRWLRSIRSVAPLAYAFLFVCFTWPVASIGWLLADDGMFSDALLLTAVTARLVLHWLAVRDLERSFIPLESLKNSVLNWGLVPVRDSLAWMLWMTALAGNVVRWRGRPMKIARRSGRRS